MHLFLLKTIVVIAIIPILANGVFHFEKFDERNKKFFYLLSCIVCLIITSNVYADPANDAFLNDDLYKCIIDTFNTNLSEKKDYTYVIMPEELNTITNLDCSSYKEIDDLTGLDRLNNLTSLNLSGNPFKGGQAKIEDGETSEKLRSNIILPKSLKLTDVVYTISNPKIVKVVDGVVYPLDNGSTKVTMTAKVSGNEIKEEYSVSVNKKEFEKSSNAKLASLYLSKGEFAFDSDTKTYVTVVGNSVTSVKISANVLDKKATFVPGYGPRTVELKEGSNTILVKVKAEDGTINTYTISVDRSDGNDLNSRLVNIELSIGKIDFKPDVYIYNFTVDSNINNIDVKAVSESSLSKVEISDTKLKVGENKITIKVTSESGNSSKYELIVTREDYDSTENYLKNLNIKDYPIKFDRNVFNYSITIKNEKKLSIIPVLENSTATYNIVGNENLKNGSKVIIKVSDKEGSTREYSILVNKNSLFNYDSIKWIVLGLEFLLIIILVLILILRGRPRKPKVTKKKKKNNTGPQMKVTTNTCKACGAVNDIKSKTCYLCGNLLK